MQVESENKNIYLTFFFQFYLILFYRIFKTNYIFYHRIAKDEDGFLDVERKRKRER